ncbi:Phosphatidylinositol transfer protein (PITP) [Vanrija albida]|uniref:Phosphatidylinositol transfer protein (PITP) n=1 Tax=Vanrija albida TaxID=181172 RepID=A0ABR3Q1J6_9TREE
MPYTTLSHSPSSTQTDLTRGDTRDTRYTHDTRYTGYTTSISMRDSMSTSHGSATTPSPRSDSLPVNHHHHYYLDRDAAAERERDRDDAKSIISLGKKKSKSKNKDKYARKVLPLDGSQPVTFPVSLLIQPPVNIPAQWPTDAERHALDSFRRYFSTAGYSLPCTEGTVGTAPLTEREMMFLISQVYVNPTFPTACMHLHGRPAIASAEPSLTCITANHGEIGATIQKIEKTIVWRRTMRMDDMYTQAKMFQEELKSGKYIVQGFTEDGRPVFYMFTARNDMPAEARRPLVILFMIERAMDLMADGVSDIVFIVDFNGKRSDSISSSVSLTRATLKLMNKYYPEICNLAILQGASWITRAFAGLVNKVIDFKVNYKLCGGFAAKHTNADPDNLLGEVGGNLEIPYHHASYWPTLLATCESNRVKNLRRWRDLGDPSVGRSERLFKTGNVW